MRLANNIQLTQFHLRLLLLVIVSLTATACHTVSPTVLRGQAAINATGVASPGLTPGDYLIGPADVLNVTVLYEPDLSVSSATVDANGSISVPLVGMARVAGKTAAQAAEEIESRLAGRYVRDPHVAVNVTEFARQSVTVEGDVKVPGVYKIPPSSSLLQTLALARGPTGTAKLSEVIVFRTVNHQRMGALFDLRRIRYGYEPDPLILGGDVVVVGFSELKGVYRDFLSAAPALAVFRPY